MSYAATATAFAPQPPAASSGSGSSNPTPYQRNLNVHLICPDCREVPPNLVENFSDGDMVCGSCGLVLGDRIVDTRSEWRTFANDDQGNDDPSRVGEAVNPLLNGSQLDTMISYGAQGSTAGRELNRAQNKVVHDKRDTALQAAYSKISQMCERYSLPRIVQDTAKDIFKKVEDHRKLKGKSQESIEAAAIFIACRQSGVPRAFKEICLLTNVPKKEIGRVFKVIDSILLESGSSLNAQVGATDQEYQAVGTNAEDLMNRFCSHLGLTTQVASGAQYIARQAAKEGILAGRSPISIAAATIYMAAGLFGEARSAAKIAERAGVSDGTIKTSYKFLWEARDKLVDPVWIESKKASMSGLPKV
ncbi:general RNA polymerase II transcription factor, TFIIB subunit [Myxozyma melibiosi]|uniref:General transcription factor TFIIB n=1 Tax=Myxozyma melibiosi TaxID=54550 RepID=A0ABR1F2K1_9ASCO